MTTTTLPRVLLLGGTADARQFAQLLVERGYPVTSSLAGRVAQPKLPVGKVRIGGFGGVDGLRDALAGYDLVVDATHPFAAGMSANARQACATPVDGRRIPLLRFERPGWPVESGWHQADDHEQAAELAAQLGRRPFLTVGRQELVRYLPALGRLEVTARVVEVPDDPMPDNWQLVCTRGPYTLLGDRALLLQRSCDMLVTKNSGGEFTRSKLQAAAELGIPVVVIRRPPAPDDVPLVHTSDEALDWVLARTQEMR